MTEDYLEPCPDDHFYCQSRMTVDWYAAGDQTIVFERSCAKTEVVPEEQCFGGGNAVDQPLFKDCKITCNSDNCNNEDSTEEVEVNGSITDKRCLVTLHHSRLVVPDSWSGATDLLMF